MLESLNLSAQLSKTEARAQIISLRQGIRDAQQGIRASRIPVVVIFEGWEAAGKGDSIAHLVYPLDPRGFKVRSTESASEDDLSRPFLWRFWKDLPARGDFVFFDRSWYRALLEDRVDGELTQQEARGIAAEIREHERSLLDDGFILVKFWLHVSKEQRERRLAHRKEEFGEVRFGSDGRRRSEKKCRRAAEEMLELTSTTTSPWTLVEAEDANFRRVKVMRAFHGALARALAESVMRAAPAAVPPDSSLGELRERARIARVVGPPNLLDAVDLGKKLSREEYELRLNPLQKRLRDLAYTVALRRLPVVVCYEGWDAAGKGGNIKRLTQEVDPRAYEVIPIAAPNEIERSRHYLWRFWRELPRAGRIAIFDRTWYGRVLVERVEGFATEPEWRRAYEEINRFERHLTDFGSLVVKFWLHLSPEEQLRRFEDREIVLHKTYKIGPEDWRNRLKWNETRAAVAEMIERTTTSFAPWTIVESENKFWARIKTLETLVGAIEARLEK